MNRELIDVVESVYREIEIERPNQWLARVLPKIVACVGWDHGGYANAYDLAGPHERWRLSVPLTHDLPASVADTVLRCFELSPPDVARKLFLSSGPVGTFSSLAGVTFDQMPGEGGMSAQVRGDCRRTWQSRNSSRLHAR